MAVSRGFGEGIPDEGAASVMYDDSIVRDTAVEKEQDMREVGVTMNAWEYRVKWYGEDEKTAKLSSVISPPWPDGDNSLTVWWVNFEPVRFTTCPTLQDGHCPRPYPTILAQAYAVVIRTRARHTCAAI